MSRLASGRPLAPMARQEISAGDTLVLELPGGGYGRPEDRAPQAVIADVCEGYVTAEQARSAYDGDADG